MHLVHLSLELRHVTTDILQSQVAEVLLQLTPMRYDITDVPPKHIDTVEPGVDLAIDKSTQCLVIANAFVEALKQRPILLDKFEHVIMAALTWPGTSSGVSAAPPD